MDEDGVRLVTMHREHTLREVLDLHTSSGPATLWTRRSTPPLPRSRNTLDKALHSRGEEILDQNRKKWAEEGMLETLPKLSDSPSPAINGQITARRHVRFPFRKPKDPKPGDTT